MSPQTDRPMLFVNRGNCPIDRSSSLTARFSAIFRDFPNTGPPTAEIGYFSAGVAGAGRADSTWWDARAMGEVDDS